MVCWQCAKACHNKTYDNERAVRQMVRSQRDMRIPSELLPYCPVCGAPMTMNLRIDELFVQDEGWYAAQKRYEDFLCKHKHSNILYMELGVGLNTPSIIKLPFWKTDLAESSRDLCLPESHRSVLPSGTRGPKSVH